ncbi:26S proteasome regulatory subunit RPN2 [Gossypium arboreum]|nr:26S proteasome regulatory subunit RPN2 [Gossypium arboreum]
MTVDLCQPSQQLNDSSPQPPPVRTPFPQQRGQPLDNIDLCFSGPHFRMACMADSGNKPHLRHKGEGAIHLSYRIYAVGITLCISLQIVILILEGMSRSHNFFVNCTVILGVFLCILMVDEDPVATTDRIPAGAITPLYNHVFVNRAG